MYGPVLMPILLSTLAGLSTGIGSFISLFIKRLKQKYLCMALGFSAGVMIYISFIDLLKSSIISSGFIAANLAFFAGIAAIAAIDFLIPHEYIEEKITAKNKKLMFAGLMVALGITIHNFPEGIAVAMSSLKSLSFGIPIAVAIALHNIPEGISVAMPIFYATRNRKKAIAYSFLSGLAEPVGAVISILILRPFITEYLLSLILAAIAGVMVFITFDELLPMSSKKGLSHITILGIILGMMAMALSQSFF